MKYTITGKGYSSNFDGKENFKRTARAILRDNGLNDSDFFELKTDLDYINALKEKGYEVKTKKTYMTKQKTSLLILQSILTSKKKQTARKALQPLKLQKLRLTKNQDLQQFTIAEIAVKAKKKLFSEVLKKQLTSL